MIHFAYVNKEMIYSNRLDDIIAKSFLVLHVRFTPFGLLKRNCQRIIEHNLEWLMEEREQHTGSERAGYERAITKLDRMQAVFSTTRTRREFMRRYYNFLLSLDGCGLLHGYGFSNAFGDRIRGDAEKESYRGYTLIGKEGREEKKRR